jgi:clan AA aspartic protease
MSHVHRRVKLSADKTATVTMLIDTGATYSMISEELARSLGVTCLRRPITVTLADGRRGKRPIGTAIVRIDGREAPATVLVGGAADPILGALALEALGLRVDPRSGRLKPTRSYAVRA